MSLLDTRIAVETPERVRFRYQVAGPGRRGLAWLIDLALRAVVLVVMLALLGALTYGASTDLTELSLGAVLLLLFVLEWVYGAAFEILLSGSTPGKLAVGLRVVRADGSPASVSDLILRNVLRGVDYLPLWPMLGDGSVLFVPTCAVGLLCMVLDPRLRRIGDLVGGTVVIVDAVQSLKREIPIAPPITVAEREALPTRVDLTAEELRVIEAFLRRRPKLSSARAEELATLYAPQLSVRTGIVADRAERVLALAYARATQRTE